MGTAALTSGSVCPNKYGNKTIQEFMIATDMSSSGDPEEKLRWCLIGNKELARAEPMVLRWAFRMYDKDGSGGIELEEMIEIFCLMYAVQVGYQMFADQVKGLVGVLLKSVPNLKS